MRYMIYDDEGNALGSFRSRIAAEGSLRAIAAADPDVAQDLVLMVYRDDGTFTGRALTVEDVGPPVRVAPNAWVINVAYAAYAGRRAARPTVNRYEPLILAGRREPEPLVRPATRHEHDVTAATPA